MKNENMESKIKDAFEKATPDVLDRILSDVDGGREVIVMNEAPRRRSILRRGVALAAAFAVIVGTVIGMFALRESDSLSATVSLDVNPSVTIEVNSKDSVIGVTAGNVDGEQIIGDMDFAGSSLDVTVSALVGSMLKHGYISEMSNSILVSVNGDDHSRSTELKDKLTRDIDKLLRTENFSGAVIGQTVEDADLGELAEKYGITEGKAQLIRRIINGNESYAFEDLVALSINELNLIADSPDTKVDDVDTLGSPSDKAYIGQDSAISAAMEHAGLIPEDVEISEAKAEMKLKDGVMVYEVDLSHFGNSYGFTINATDGTLVIVGSADDNSSATDVTAEPPATEISGSSGETAPVPQSETTAANPTPATTTTAAKPETTTTTAKPETTTTAKPKPVTTTTTTPAPEPEPEPELPIYFNEQLCLQIAMRHAVGAMNIIDPQAELVVDNGTPKYKIRFWSTNFYKKNGYRHDYEINAYSGTIISSKTTDDASHYPESREVILPSVSLAKGAATVRYREYSGAEIAFINELCTGDGAVFNTNKLSNRGVPPILAFDTTEKFDSFMEMVNGAAGSDASSLKESRDFIADAALYDSEFFKTNNLYVVSLIASHSAVYYDIDLDHVEGRDGSSYLQVRVTNRDHGKTDKTKKYTLVAFAIPKADVNGTTFTEGWETVLDVSSISDTVTKLYYMKKEVGN